MHPEIKKLLERLRSCQFDKDNMPNMLNERKLTVRDALHAASILQAVFDPENQPSQYGTQLVQRDIPGSGPPA